MNVSRLLEDKEKLCIAEVEDLEINSRECARPEFEKAKEKHLKEVEKELSTDKKIVDEINSAETPELKVNDTRGKVLKIKQFTEKLSLSEEDIEEAIPKDLAKEYRKRGMIMNRELDHDYLDYDTDLQKAQYNQITKEEAKQAIRDGRWQDIRLLINGRLVNLKQDGYATTNSRYRTIVPYGKEYTNRSGKVTRDTANMSKEHLLSIADKIYLTNERSPEAKKDPQKMAARAQHALDTRDETKELNTYYDRVGDETRSRISRSDIPWRSKKSLIKDLRNKEEEIKDIKQRLNSTTDQEGVDRLTKILNDAQRHADNIRNSINTHKDFEARQRYAQSEIDLQQKWKKYKDLKSQVNNYSSRVSDAQKNLDKARTQGAPSTAKARKELENLMADLKELNKRIAICELRLEDTDGDDRAEVEAREREFNFISNEFNSVKSELSKLLGGKTLATEGLSDKALLNLLDITSRGLNEQLNDIIDEMFTEDISDKELDELLSDDDLDDLFGGEDEE